MADRLQIARAMRMNRRSCHKLLTAVIAYVAFMLIVGCAAPVQPDHTPARYRHLAIEVSAARPGEFIFRRLMVADINHDNVTSSEMITSV